MNSKIHDPYIDAFYDAILALDTKEECDKFFEDICTISEIKSISQRLKVAVMLDNGKTYSEITEETGISTATISRVNKCLEYGADGYRIVLDKIKSSDNNDNRGV